jgi:hypothetical protein
MFPTHLKINYQGQLVTYIDPPGLNRPRSLMEHEGKLYVLALDATARSRKDWRWRAFRQEGNSFKEIDAKDFPRSIAILNIWRPNDPQRYATGNEGQLDYLAMGLKLNPEDKYFANSDQARLWFMLEVENSIWAAYGGKYSSTDHTLVRQYIAKYKPVRLTSMEMRPVSKYTREKASPSPGDSP